MQIRKDVEEETGDKAASASSSAQASKLPSRRGA